jgi:streptogramin lyase
LLSAITEFPLPSPLASPGSLTVGPDGNLWFPEGDFSKYGAKIGKIGRITPAGAVTEFPIPAGVSPSDLTVGPDGNLWFSENFPEYSPEFVPPAGKIARITPAGAVTEFSVSASDGTGLSNLTIGPDGNLWFSESASGGTAGPAAVGRITPAGAVTAFPLPSTEDGIAGALTAGPDGNLWFPELHESNAPQKIGRITPAGAVTEFPFPAGHGPAGALTVGPDGNLWFSEYSPLHGYSKIGRITLVGHITEFRVPTADIGLGNLTVGPDGDLWFPEDSHKTSGSNKIGRITPSGHISEFPLRSTKDSALAAHDYLSDLTVGPDGNLWFSGVFYNDSLPGAINPGAIYRITPSGALTQFPLPAGGGADLTVGPDGNLWFPHGGIGRVDPTPPRVTGVLAVTNSSKAITSILLDFDEALDPGAAERVGFYSLASGVERGHQFVFSKGVKIARVSYDATARTVTLELAKPQKRSIRVKVRAGLVAADGMSSTRDFTAVVA